MTLFGAFHDTNFADSLFRVQDLRLPCRLRLPTVVNVFFSWLHHFKGSFIICAVGGVSGKKFHIVSRIGLWDTLEYSLWTSNGILKEKFGASKLPSSSSAKLSF